MPHSARFSLRVPTRAGGLDIDISIDPHPGQLRYSTKPIVIRVTASCTTSELGLGTFHRRGHIEWSHPLHAHSSLTASEMVESRVRSIIQTFLRLPPRSLKRRGSRRAAAERERGRLP